LTREAFSKRRKLITNSLKSFFTEEDLINLGIERKSRPENLSVETYIKLAKSIQSG
jgi:16S rRNA (adenine1518-N6/adenine1519-N6)-dimethyltransferase